MLKNLAYLLIFITGMLLSVLFPYWGEVSFIDMEARIFCLEKNCRLDKIVFFSTIAVFIFSMLVVFNDDLKRLLRLILLKIKKNRNK